MYNLDETKRTKKRITVKHSNLSVVLIKVYCRKTELRCLDLCKNRSTHFDPVRDFDKAFVVSLFDG